MGGCWFRSERSSLVRNDDFVISSEARNLDSVLQYYREIEASQNRELHAPHINEMAQTTLTPNLQRLALSNVCLGQFLSALDSRSVNVALPTISLHFDTSMAAVQWIPL